MTEIERINLEISKRKCEINVKTSIILKDFALISIKKRYI